MSVISWFLKMVGTAMTLDNLHADQTLTQIAESSVNMHAAQT